MSNLMSSLYIYGGTKEKNINSDKNDYIYHINTGQINGPGQVIDDLKRVHEIALENRDQYISYIDNLNKHFLQNNLVYENKISSFFFSDLFNKRTEVFDTYTSICHILYLKGKITNNIKIKNIVLINCTDMFLQSISSAFKKIKISKQNIRNTSISLFNAHCLQSKYFIKTFLQLMIIKAKHKRMLFNDIPGRLFLSRYPLCFDSNFQEIKYVNMVEDQDKYLISIVTDGMHQNIGFKQSADCASELKKQKNVILLDIFVSQMDIIKSIISHFMLIRKLKKLIKHEYHFSSIKISKFLEKELIQSFLRLPRLFMYRNALIKVFSRMNIDKFIFYLHEYSYGRFFNYVIAKHFPLIERIGFQHGPASKRKLLYFMSKKSVSNKSKDWLIKTPIPNRVLAEDDLSRKVYEEAGYNNVEVMKKIYRLYYLDKIKRSHINQKQVLIVSGLHDGDALLNRIIKTVKANPSKHYLFKPHPKSGISKSGIPKQYQTNNIELVNGHIKNYLESVSEVISTYSSVGLEAYLLGIKVSLVYLPNKINESPLLDIYEEGDTRLITNIW